MLMNDPQLTSYALDWLAAAISKLEEAAIDSSCDRVKCGGRHLVTADDMRTSLISLIESEPTWIPPIEESKESME